ncbi:hypothetical protein FACS1894174_03030 [Bacteroidia bacterium]|nr:hypothetical protein FACS1894155_04240 [Bacteroidia bacterium]GHV20683.1 hypothetical protein FACS1894174_03030 [Bacteroidia bacterium]
MWTKSHSIVTKEVTKEQMWKLWSDVNSWATWDKTIEFASLEGKFEAGNVYYFQRRKRGRQCGLFIVASYLFVATQN